MPSPSGEQVSPIDHGEPRTCAALLHGCVRLTTESAGWQRPWRLVDMQIRAVGSCQAWHPGILRQMARTTAGITIEFETDATEVTAEIALDDEPRATSAVLGRMESPGMHDGLSADIDERHVGGLVPEGGRLTLSLEDLDHSGMQAVLPGLGEAHRVRIWLPALRGCILRGIAHNGSYLKAVPQRAQLLVLGDSIAQGFVTDDPARSWPALVATSQGLDLVNQGLGGQVFQPGTLLGLEPAVSPKAIVVALGENYRYEPCREHAVARDVRNFLAELSRTWPQVPTYVCTPLWHDESRSPSHAFSCWRLVPRLIEASAAAHRHMAIVDGQRLMDHDARLLADDDGHPSSGGARQIAQRLSLAMRARQGSAEERRQRALAVLAKAPRRAFPLLEAARRGMGEFVLEEEGCVLLDTGDHQLLLYAPDHEAGRAALAILCDSVVLCLLEPSLVDAARELGGYGEPAPYHLAFYKGAEPPRVDPGFDIRQLGERHLAAMRAGCSHPEFVDEDELLRCLRAGLVLGGFEGGELVGFVGERAAGSIGMLEVFEGHRRKGWGYALEAAKIADTLARGQTPWAEVLAGNTAALSLQRKLGMIVTPAREQCLLARVCDR